MVDGLKIWVNPGIYEGVGLFQESFKPITHAVGSGSILPPYTHTHTHTIRNSLGKTFTGDAQLIAGNK